MTASLIMSGQLPASPPAAPSQRTDRSVPGWLDAIVVLPAIGLTALGLVGIPLLLVGAFRPLWVALVCGPVFVVLAVVWARVRPRGGRTPRSVTVPAVLALLLALLSAGYNAHMSDQHLIVDGDPAVYAVSGQLIAETGGAVIATHAQDVFGGESGLIYHGTGFFRTDDGAGSYPQFFHLLPVTLAIGSWVGGPGLMLKVNALLGGLALLAVFIFGARLVRPWWALLATSALAVTFPQVFFSRDTFSEIPSQLLCFAGLVLLWDGWRRRRSGAPAFVVGLLAGAVFGSSAMARIDAFFYLVPVAAFLVIVVLRSLVGQERDGRHERLLAAGVAAGVAAGALVGYADGHWGTPAYLAALGNQVTALMVLAMVIAVAGVAAVALRGWLFPLTRRLRPWQPALANGAAVLILAVAAYAWFLRPRIEVNHHLGLSSPHPGVVSRQLAEGLSVDGLRSYDEMTMRWLSWYLGAAALGLGVVGLALLTRRLIRGRDLAALPFVLLVGSVTALYVWRPSIMPVQIWAMRRFLPVVFPGLLLSAAWTAALLVRALRRRLADRPGSLRRSRRRRVTVGLTGVLLVTALLAPPLAYAADQGQTGYYDKVLPAIRSVCAELQPNDAALLVGRPSVWLVQTVEVFCRVPAAVATPSLDGAGLDRIVRSAQAAGRRLVVLRVASTLTPETRDPVLGLPMRQIADVTVDTSALSLSHRPDEAFKERVQVLISPMPS
ncbi:MAG: hypothetical protein ACXV5Q_06330 [Frankiaceae bacterium]